jgi:uncharacterized OsmC-like protein
MADQVVRDQSSGTTPSGSHRSVTVERTSTGRYTATNVRGGTITIATGGAEEFTPVELLLAGIAACSAVDVDFITSRRSEPEHFTATASGEKIADELGNRLVELLLDFDVRFPDDEGGQKAAEVLRRTIKQSHDRLCSVGRTVEVGTPITAALRGEPV